MFNYASKNYEKETFLKGTIKIILKWFLSTKNFKYEIKSSHVFT